MFSATTAFARILYPYAGAQPHPAHLFDHGSRGQRNRLEALVFSTSHSHDPLMSALLFISLALFAPSTNAAIVVFHDSDHPTEAGRVVTIVALSRESFSRSNMFVPCSCLTYSRGFDDRYFHSVLHHPSQTPKYPPHCAADMGPIRREQTATRDIRAFSRLAIRASSRAAWPRKLSDERC